MTKFAGLVGYATPAKETAPGVWSAAETSERLLRGDVIQQSKTENTSTKINDDVILQNRLSLVADKYAFQNYHNIRYVKMDGGVWKVTAIAVANKRLILTLGGVWNG